MKKLLLLSFFILTFIRLLGANVSATIGGFRYNLDTSAKTAEITYKTSVNSSNYPNSSITVPSSVAYQGETYTVTGVDGFAFINCTNLTELNLPNTITYIDSYIIDGCRNIKTINLKVNPNLVFKGSLFGTDTKISNLYLNIDNISNWCSVKLSILTFNDITNFYIQLNGKDIDVLEIPEGVKNINAHVFMDVKNITRIILPSSLESIGEWCFYTSGVRRDMICYATIPPIVDRYGVSTVVTLYVPQKNIQDYKNADQWNGITNIYTYERDSDFEYDGISYNIVSILDMTCEVGPYNQSLLPYDLTEISIPEEVTYQGRVFKVIGIGEKAFANATSSTIFLPQTIEYINAGAFMNCDKLTSLTVPNTISKYSENLSSLKINKLHIYGNGEEFVNNFAGCKNLKTVTFDTPNLKHICTGAFQNCEALESVQLPPTITLVDNNLFAYCSLLYTIDIPSSVVEIGEQAFMNCTRLESFVINKEITTIGARMLYGCTSLKALTIMDSETPLVIKASSTGIFIHNAPLSELYIGRDILFNDNLNPFASLGSLSSLFIGENVNFYPATGDVSYPLLEMLKIGNSLTAMPSFNKSVKLKSLEIGANLAVLPSFSDCKALTKIRLRSGEPQYIEGDFANKVYTDCSLEVPQGSLSYYQKADIWKKFFTAVEYLPENKTVLIDIVKDEYSLYPDKSLKLRPIVEPLDALNVFLWTSSNENVVEVDNFGNIRAKEVGESIVSVSTTDGSNLSALCKVIVKAINFVSEIRFLSDSYDITLGNALTPEYTISPSDATYPDVVWASSDEDIAIVEDGVVITKDIGRCTVSATATDGTEVAGYCLINVLPVYVQNIEISDISSEIVERDKVQLYVSITPEDATIRSVRWEVSDPTVAKINDDGLFETLHTGKCTVYAYTTDGSNLFAMKELEVLPMVASTIRAEINQSSGMIDLMWGALDYVRDIKDFNVYVSEDGGDFVLWLHNTTQTTAQFKGKDGGNYRFIVTMRNKDGVTETYDESKSIFINNIQK